jgi:large subunit ribosomal protein LP2
MRYLAAFALAYLSGKDSPSAADVKKILEAAGAEVDDAKISAIVDKLAGQNIAEVVASKLQDMTAVPSGAGVAASAGAAGEAAPAEEKPAEEEEEEEEDFGFDLFG